MVDVINLDKIFGGLNKRYNEENFEKYLNTNDLYKSMQVSDKFIHCEPSNGNIYTSQLLGKKKNLEAILERVIIENTSDKYIIPTAHYVIKCSSDLFINICSSELINEPRVRQINHAGQVEFVLPIYTGVHHKELRGTQAIDIIVNEKAIEIAQISANFRAFLNISAINQIEDYFNIKIEWNNLSFVNNKYHGEKVQETIISNKKSIEKILPAFELLSNDNNKTSFTLTMQLPLLDSVEDCVITCTNKTFLLQHEIYCFVLQLPKSVRSEDVLALFDTNSNVLSIQMPILENGVKIIKIHTLNDLNSPRLLENGVKGYISKTDEDLNGKHFKMKPKLRSYSECSDDPIGLSGSYKSILKKSLSLSESLGSEQVGEDGMACSSSVKKSVSFSDQISTQVFRADSSILGQRKKNQRKARNKKKSKDRRNSESDANSECESTDGTAAKSETDIGKDENFNPNDDMHHDMKFLNDMMFDLDM